MAEEVKAAEVAPTAAGGDLPNITAGDLATMVRIIDASSQRGAFKGEELETVGALRTKLATVVNALAPPQEETATESAAEETPAPAIEGEVAATVTGDESVA